MKYDSYNTRPNIAEDKPQATQTDFEKGKKKMLLTADSFGCLKINGLLKINKYNSKEFDIFFLAITKFY